MAIADGVGSNSRFGFDIDFHAPAIGSVFTLGDGAAIVLFAKWAALISCGCENLCWHGMMTV
ncbi:MAG: hypothetical protein ACI9BO_000403 [Zhongshania sp.]